jgi:hypothetical protein
VYCVLSAGRVVAVHRQAGLLEAVTHDIFQVGGAVQCLGDSVVVCSTVFDCNHRQQPPVVLWDSWQAELLEAVAHDIYQVGDAVCCLLIQSCCADVGNDGVRQAGRHALLDVARSVVCWQCFKVVHPPQGAAGSGAVGLN